VASVLNDIELGALAVAIRNGLADLDHLLSVHDRDIAEELLVERRSAGRRAIETGHALQAARDLSFGRAGYHDLASDLASLAMLPGGVRIDEIVFCARHHPGGYDARFRLSCPQCSPDDHKPGEGRDVIAVEGNI
jgi:hypothetical protein